MMFACRRGTEIDSAEKGPRSRHCGTEATSLRHDVRAGLKPAPTIARARDTKKLYRPDASGRYYLDPLPLG
jgi:hypothetical protein